MIYRHHSSNDTTTTIPSSQQQQQQQQHQQQKYYLYQNNLVVSSVCVVVQLVTIVAFSFVSSMMMMDHLYHVMNLVVVVNAFQGFHDNTFLYNHHQIRNRRQNCGDGGSSLAFGFRDEVAVVVTSFRILQQQQQQKQSMYHDRAFFKRSSSAISGTCTKQLLMRLNALRRPKSSSTGSTGGTPAITLDEDSDSNQSDDGYYNDNNTNNNDSQIDKVKMAFQTTTTSTSSSSSAALYSLDPNSDVAVTILRSKFHLQSEQIQQIQDLCGYIVKWNQQINLISRIDCNEHTVFGRHVLPSLTVCGDPKLSRFFQPSSSTGSTGGGTSSSSSSSKKINVIDVGTGGGFPGLPLAIAYPNTNFVLLDSVAKKLIAVQDIIDQLGLKNVQVYNGRAEEYHSQPHGSTSSSSNSNSKSSSTTGSNSFTSTSKSKSQNLPKSFQVVTGRSVTALPQFCSWVQHLLSSNGNGGNLVYWIGGEIQSSILQRTIYKNHVQTILQSYNVTSDKQMLVFNRLQVLEFGTEHTRMTSSSTTTTRTKKDKYNSVDRLTAARSVVDRMDHRSTTTRRGNSNNNNNNKKTDDQMMMSTSTTATNYKKKLAKGEWKKKRTLRDDMNEPYRYSSMDSNQPLFQRYKSSSITTPSSSSSTPSSPISSPPRSTTSSSSE